MKSDAILPYFGASVRLGYLQCLHLHTLFLQEGQLFCLVGLLTWPGISGLKKHEFDAKKD